MSSTSHPSSFCSFSPQVKNLNTSLSSQKVTFLTVAVYLTDEELSLLKQVTLNLSDILLNLCHQ